MLSAIQNAATGKPASLASEMAQEVERMILSGALKSGQRINENQLAARFRVSRGPVREAVRALEGAGLVQSVPNRGVFVRTLSIDEVRELYDVRAALFALAGRLMAQRAQDADIAALQALLPRMEAAAGARNIEIYYPLNLELHRLIVEGSGNRTLAGNYARQVRSLNLFRARSLVQDGGLAASNREHRDMVEAIAARDPTWAHEAHWRHVMTAKDRLLALVRAENNQHAGDETS